MTAPPGEFIVSDCCDAASGEGGICSSSEQSEILKNTDKEERFFPPIVKLRQRLQKRRHRCRSTPTVRHVSPFGVFEAAMTKPHIKTLSKLSPLDFRSYICGRITPENTDNAFAVYSSAVTHNATGSVASCDYLTQRPPIQTSTDGAIKSTTSNASHFGIRIPLALGGTFLAPQSQRCGLFFTSDCKPFASNMSTRSEKHHKFGYSVNPENLLECCSRLKFSNMMSDSTVDTPDMPSDNDGSPEMTTKYQSAARPSSDSYRMMVSDDTCCEYQDGLGRKSDVDMEMNSFALSPPTHTESDQLLDSRVSSTVTSAESIPSCPTSGPAVSPCQKYSSSSIPASQQQPYPRETDPMSTNPAPHIDPHMCYVTVMPGFQVTPAPFASMPLVFPGLPLQCNSATSSQQPIRPAFYMPYMPGDGVPNVGHAMNNNQGGITDTMNAEASGQQYNCGNVQEEKNSTTQRGLNFNRETTGQCELFKGSVTPPTSSPPVQYHQAGSLRNLPETPAGPNNNGISAMNMPVDVDNGAAASTCSSLVTSSTSILQGSNTTEMEQPDSSMFNSPRRVHRVRNMREERTRRSSAPMTPLGAQVETRGNHFHASGQCRTCVSRKHCRWRFFWSSVGCAFGADCKFCHHLEHVSEYIPSPPGHHSHQPSSNTTPVHPRGHNGSTGSNNNNNNSRPFIQQQSSSSASSSSSAQLGAFRNYGNSSTSHNNSTNNNNAERHGGQGYHRRGRQNVHSHNAGHNVPNRLESYNGERRPPRYVNANVNSHIAQYVPQETPSSGNSSNPLSNNGIENLTGGSQEYAPPQPVVSHNHSTSHSPHGQTQQQGLHLPNILPPLIPVHPLQQSPPPRLFFGHPPQQQIPLPCNSSGPAFPSGESGESTMISASQGCQETLQAGSSSTTSILASNE